MIQNCVYCDSTLEFRARLDAHAKPLQELKCPVCGYPYYFDSGFPLTKTYSVKIIKAKIPAQKWEDRLATVGLQKPEEPDLKQAPFWVQFREGVSQDIKRKVIPSTAILAVIGSIILILIIKLK